MRPTSLRSLATYFLPSLFTALSLGLSSCGTLPGAGNPDFAYKNLIVANGSAMAGEGVSRGRLPGPTVRPRGWRAPRSAPPSSATRPCSSSRPVLTS